MTREECIAKAVAATAEEWHEADELEEHDAETLLCGDHQPWSGAIRLLSDLHDAMLEAGLTGARAYVLDAPENDSELFVALLSEWKPCEPVTAVADIIDLGPFFHQEPPLLGTALLTAVVEEMATSLEALPPAVQ